MEQVQQVFAAFGSQVAISNLIGAPLSTVNSWRKTGIPHWRRSIILAAASRLPDPLPSEVIAYLSAPRTTKAKAA